MINWKGCEFEGLVAYFKVYCTIFAELLRKQRNASFRIADLLTGFVSPDLPITKQLTATSGIHSRNERFSLPGVKRPEHNADHTPN
jgi:hypothetical protein